MRVRDKVKQAQHARLHYLNNREHMKDKAKANNAMSRARNREYVNSYLQRHPCVDCGESDPIVLEFDHIDRTKKTVEISKLIGGSVSTGRIQHEINKCEVRCANCHRRKTHREKEYKAP